MQLFIRHCHFSEVSGHKKRLPGFSREKCFDNLLKTIDNRVQGTIFLDTFFPMENKHFVLNQSRFPVIEIKEGTEAGSFLRLLDHVASLNLDPDTILYFLEDDYLHRENWIDILVEGFSVEDVSYVTLFDHRDKYLDYPYLDSHIYHTNSCHWRTTPSTTNTFAVKYGVLMQDLKIHQKFSRNRKITADHQKFLRLQAGGAKIISSIPGWSTHVEAGLTSPCIAWEKYF